MLQSDLVNFAGVAPILIYRAREREVLTISGLGTATLSAGHDNGDGSWTLQQGDLVGLTLHAGDDDTASLHLTVTASTSDNGSTPATSAAQTIDLTVNPVAETPTLTSSKTHVFPAFPRDFNQTGANAGQVYVDFGTPAAITVTLLKFAGVT